LNMEEIVPTHTLVGYNAAGLPLTHVRTVGPQKPAEQVDQGFAESVGAFAQSIDG
jgi:hypothetical protein